jgi:hypothetical protein
MGAQLFPGWATRWLAITLQTLATHERKDSVSRGAHSRPNARAMTDAIDWPEEPIEAKNLTLNDRHAFPGLYILAQMRRVLENQNKLPVLCVPHATILFTRLRRPGSHLEVLLRRREACLAE